MENSPFSSTDWMRSWVELQQKFWQESSNMAQNGWWKTVMPNMPMDFNWWKTAMPGMPSMPGIPMDFFTKAMGAMPSMTNPFAAFQTSGTQETLIKNMMASMNGFTQMAQAMMTMVQSAGDLSKAGEWPAAVEKIVEQFRSLMASAQDNPFAFPFFNPTGPMNQSLDIFNQVLAGNPLFSQLNSALPASAGPMALLQTILAFPGVGIGREKQEVIQRAMSYGMDFQKSFAEYSQLKNGMKVKALEKLHAKLLELGKGEKKIETLRDAFVLWIDCLEEAHAELVVSEKYLETNARMVKDMMNFRKTFQGLMDDMLEAANIPNRREVDSAYKKIQVLKRQMREMDDELKELRARSGELENMRHDLEALKAHAEKTLGPVPASERKPGNKKAHAAKGETENKGA
ncbi:MAG: hypothetical protein HQL78_06430 [Magnetococcales bacterium]|nr:hypothetical protein [Magnetococcales bacterium]